MFGTCYKKKNVTANIEKKNRTDVRAFDIALSCLVHRHLANTKLASSTTTGTEKSIGVFWFVSGKKCKPLACKQSAGCSEMVWKSVLLVVKGAGLCALRVGMFGAQATKRNRKTNLNLKATAPCADRLAPEQTKRSVCFLIIGWHLMSHVVSKCVSKNKSIWHYIVDFTLNLQIWLYLGSVD